MSDASDPSDISDSETRQHAATTIPATTTAAPRIKLKLRLNPSASSASAVPSAPAPDSDDESSHRKKKKHKKKRSHKKRKKRSQDTDDDDNGSFTHQYDNRRDSEAMTIDSDASIGRTSRSIPGEYDAARDDEAHMHYGGKRPFSMIQEEDEEDEEGDERDVHMDGPDGAEDVYQQADAHSVDYYGTRETFGHNSYGQEDDGYSTYGAIRSGSVDHAVHPTDNLSVSTTASRTTKKSKTHTSTSAAAAAAAKGAPKKRGRPAKNKTQPKPEARVVDHPKKDFKTVCNKLLDSFVKKDSYGLFHYPVDTTLIQDYLDIIKHPMDLSTMRRKLESGDYEDLESFKQDVVRITTNSRTYNAPDTIYAKQADRLEEYAKKAIDKAAKTIVYDDVQYESTTSYAEQHSWSPRRLSSMSAPRKDSNIKIEEEVDILGLDNTSSYSAPARKASRTNVEFGGDASSSRAATPTKNGPTKKKKKKVTDAGIAYGPDGSLVSIGGADLSMLVPSERRFAELPEIITTNIHALPSAFFTNRNTYDEWSSNKHFVHNATFCDYGAFTALGQETPGAFYTAQDACYIYPLYGDDRGEAYMRSLWDFVDGLDLDDVVDTKSRELTRGAWDVLKQALNGPENGAEVGTEFGTIRADDFRHAYDNVMEDTKGAS